MPRFRRVQKLDANHIQVCTEARQQGVDVVEILKPVDAIAHLAGYVSFIEIKSQKVFTREQLKFISETRFPVAVVRSGSELVDVMRNKKALSQKQKDEVSAFLLREKADKWNRIELDQMLTV